MQRETKDEGRTPPTIRGSLLAKNNNWSNKVLKARHDRLMEMTHSFWYSFIEYQNMVYEYRQAKKIQSVDNEHRWHPMQLGSSLLNDVVMLELPMTDEQVDEDKEYDKKK